MKRTFGIHHIPTGTVVGQIESETINSGPEAVREWISRTDEKQLAVLQQRALGTQSRKGRTRTDKK
jgi:hypothetical protein